MDRRFKIALLLIAAVCAACRNGSSETRRSAQVLPQKDQPLAAGAAATIKTVAPEYRTRTATIETSGKIQFNEEQLVRVNAPLTGRVVEVLARPGDVVESGHRLLVLDSPDLGSAKSDYAKAVADLERSEKAFNLARDLFEVKANSEKELHDAENDYRKAAAEKERAASRLLALGLPQAQLKNVATREDASTQIVVRGPRGGVIVERNVTSGQAVTFGQSDTPTNLFVIADLNSMWVVADVYEPDIPKVRLGQSVTITPPCCPNERFDGKVTYISDSVDPQTRTVKVRAVVPNRGRMLKAEMFVRATMYTGSSTVLAIPQSAVQGEEGQTFVLVDKGNGSYERRPVKLGSDLDGIVEVLAGITPQDRIVSTGSILLKKSEK
jgi:cobalt-zinc-cadmium efflux system membrane fusion protein